MALALSGTIGKSRYGVWKQTLLGSLGLLSACGGQATGVSDSSSSGGTTSGNVDNTGAGATGSETSGSGSATGTGRSTATSATTTSAATGSGGTQPTNVTHRVEPTQCDPFYPSPESAIPPSISVKEAQREAPRSHCRTFNASSTLTAPTV